MRPLYLKPYPLSADLMSTLPIPEALLSAFKQVAETVFGPVYNAGPFCSELACHLLAESKLTSGPRSAAATAPSDLARSDQFVELPIVFKKSEV